MVSWLISRLVVLMFGILYPAYSSYKAVRTKNVREYVRWMMYWIVFALFTTFETFTDLLLSWIPFYYELKIALVVWLLSPYTKGSSVLYRKFVHPMLSSREQEIDEYIVQAKEKSYETMVRFGRRGLNLAANAAVTAAAKGQGALSQRLRSFSMQDLSSIPDEEPMHGDMGEHLRSTRDTKFRNTSRSFDLSDSHERLQDDPTMRGHVSDGERSDGFDDDDEVEEGSPKPAVRRAQSLRARKAIRPQPRSDAVRKSPKLRIKKSLPSNYYGTM
ncbi:receptor expression-enhancing protein 1-like [Petromyzon marinus]|uniref:Receptor expression-enhancing protein n=1 Tax=Petromyzon marinus TaxID=7757 RepID=A0AAJ7SY52_PETMA|nr:receptor expression-enhancing protein 1-like [Petromyzon marinus]